jgi:hypothetical protein
LKGSIKQKFLHLLVAYIVESDRHVYRGGVPIGTRSDVPTGTTSDVPIGARNFGKCVGKFTSKKT